MAAFPETPLPTSTYAQERVLDTPELRDMVFRAIACPRVFCKLLGRLRHLSKRFSSYYELAMDSLYTPSLFARMFFSDAQRAIDLVQQTGALMAGSAVRQFMYDFTVADGWLVFMVNEEHADSILLFVESQGFNCYDTFTPFDPVHPRVCRRALCSYRFVRQDPGRERRLSVQVTLHAPMRTLFSTIRPYGMQACDGWRFFDLYPKLGRAGPPLSLSDGKHTHLLTASKCLEHLPADTFSLEPVSLSQPSVSFVERWIGDSHTWVVPLDFDTSDDYLFRQGWAIRLHARRVNAAQDHHFWTDTIARCLRHALLDKSYAGPPPAVAYAKRVLDCMRDALATGASEVRGPHEGTIEDFDLELGHIFDCYRVGFDYQFHASSETVVVDRSHCNYNTWGFTG
ncbi:hypothetical protein AURDEDRAFT_129648 [Auricularia subglabra TFB-10046 SS5]|nr:hypothetical protein AURDEDRAFT_129648 [Auricularia subglabra TFB-10046 SS5]